MYRYFQITLAILIICLCAGCVRRIGYGENTPAAQNLPGLPTATTQQSPTTRPGSAANLPAPSQTDESQPSLPSPDLAQTPHDTLQWLSPDGKWQVETMIAIPVSGDGNSTGEQYFRRVTVSQTTGNQIHTILDGWAPWGLGATTPEVLRWSQDGNQVYLVDSALPDGCPVFGYNENLRRIDLPSGEVTSIAQDLRGAFTLSPDEDWIAYFNEDRLILRNLLTGAEQAYLFDAEQSGWIAGDIVWSPDGSQLVFAAVKEPCSGVPAGIFGLDRSTSELYPLVLETQLIHILDWPEPNRIRMSDVGGNHWWLDIETGAVTPANNDSP